MTEESKAIWEEIDNLKAELEALKSKKIILKELSQELKDSTATTASLVEQLDALLDGRGTE